jgi:hypothetical protein
MFYTCKVGRRRLINEKENEVLTKELQIMFSDLAAGLRFRRREKKYGKTKRATDCSFVV